MPLQCKVVRGLVKEVEDELNQYLATHEVHVLHMAQSETGNHLSVTLVVEQPDPLR